MLGRTPSIRRRIMLLLVGVAALFVVGQFGWSFLVSSQGAIARKERSLEMQTLFSSVADLKASALSAYVADLSCWDELVAFVGNQNPAFANDNLVQTPQRYEIDGTWVLEPSGNQIYGWTNNKLPNVKNLGISAQDLKAAFNSGPLAHFYLHRGPILLEVRAAKICSSRDLTRLGPYSGILLAARAWDKDYLDRLAKLTATKLALETSQPTQKEAFGAPPTFIVDLAGPNSKPVSFLVVSKPQVITNMVTDAPSRVTLLFLVFALLILWTLYGSLVRWVVQPLNYLSTSLESGSAKSLISLKKDRTEFGQIANLVDAFFKQRGELTKEIEEKRRTEEALVRAKEKAETATRLKSEFVANISHEIRTPLSSMIGIIDLLSESQLDEEQAEFLGILSNSARSLRSIINDVLDYSKMESGHLRVERVKFSLMKVLRDTGMMYRRLASEKHLQLKVEIDPLMPDPLMGDPVRIQQILNNLVNNALKFTAEGYIEISVEILSENKQDVTIRLSVTDTGIGIPPERQGAIFQSFTQADGSMTRVYGGTGLGLTICRTLAELMGGQVGVRSKPNKGSTFWVELTLGKATDDQSPLVVTQVRDI